MLYFVLWPNCPSPCSSLGWNCNKFDVDVKWCWFLESWKTTCNHLPKTLPSNLSWLVHLQSHKIATSHVEFAKQFAKFDQKNEFQSCHSEELKKIETWKKLVVW
jgi:hypothetical protein